MGLIIGPTTWWANEVAAACPVGTTLPDGSRVFCKAGGTAWIMAPIATEVGSTWVDGKYNGIDAPGLEVCCICEWTTLCSRLISCGFNPCDWFVPNASQMQSARTFCSIWDFSGSNTVYWTSTESTTVPLTTACTTSFFASCTNCNSAKTFSANVRAMRCVTY